MHQVPNLRQSILPFVSQQQVVHSVSLKCRKLKYPQIITTMSMVILINPKS